MSVSDATTEKLSRRSIAAVASFQKPASTASPMRYTWQLRILLSFIAGALCLSIVHDSAAQSLTGTSALIRTPTATFARDGVAHISSGFIHRDFSPVERGNHNVITTSAALTFLPGVELGFRFNRKLGVVDALGDRMLIARLRLSREGRYRPALAVGLHDFVRSSKSVTTKFHAFYLVGSKSVNLPEAWPLLAIEFHAGYATDVLDAQSYELVGLFGGVSVAPASFTETLIEFDGDYVNLGQRVRVLKYLELLIAVQDFRQVVGGGSIAIPL